MFGRKKKDRDVGTPCPFCDHLNELGSTACVQCYYEFQVSARNQPMAEPTTAGSELINLLMSENEQTEDDGPMVEAVLSMDDISIDVEQYAVQDVVPSTDDDEEENSPIASFEFMTTTAPMLSQTRVAIHEEEEDLLPTDAPTTPVEFHIEAVDPLAQVAEPVHTGKGSLFVHTDHAQDDDMSGEVGPQHEDDEFDVPDLPPDEIQLTGPEIQAVEEHLPELPDDEPAQLSDSDSWFGADADEPDLPDLPFDDDIGPGSPPNIPAMNDSPLGDHQAIAPAGTQTPAPTVPTSFDEMTPDLPDFEDDTAEQDLPSLPEVGTDDASQVVEAGDVNLTPDLPDFDSTPEPVEEQTPTSTDNHRIWPWDPTVAWTDRQVYDAVSAIMELISHGKMRDAAERLDELGPHLDVHLDVLLHICVIMQHLNRDEHAQWTLRMAEFVYANHPAVVNAKSQLRV